MLDVEAAQQAPRRKRPTRWQTENKPPHSDLSADCYFLLPLEKKTQWLAGWLRRFLLLQSPSV